MKPGVEVFGPPKGGGVRVSLGRRLRSDPELVVKIVELNTGTPFFQHEGKLRKRTIHCKEIPNGTRVVVAAIGQYNTGAISTHGIELVAPCAIEIEAAPQQAASPGAQAQPDPLPAPFQRPRRSHLNGAIRHIIGRQR